MTNPTTDKLSAAIKFAEETNPLPRCRHDSALRDGAGELLEPPCGCRFTPTTTEAAQVAAESEVEITGSFILEHAPRFGNGKLIESELATIIDNALALSKHCDARASQWQDISTAPKGVSVLLGSPECEIVETGYAHFIDKLCMEGHRPTRWQALPAPPDTQYQE